MRFTLRLAAGIATAIAPVAGSAAPDATAPVEGSAAPNAAVAVAPAAVGVPAGYRIETIAPPTTGPFEVEGITSAPDGRVFVSTRRGTVWVTTPSSGPWQWRVYASGLAEPLGLLYRRKTGSLLVTQRTEVTELIDSNKDSVADQYRVLSTGWGYSGNYHEFAYGPVENAKGELLVTLNLSHSKEGRVQNSVMGHKAADRGWAVKLEPNGRFAPYASGLRSPAGIGRNRVGDVFVVDNQGDWMPTSAIFLLKPGRFYGHPASLADRQDFKGRDLNSIPTAEFARMRTAPAVWIPYGELANSPGEPAFDETSGRFGPFNGQMFLADQTDANLMRVSLERVHGVYQGAIFNFASGLGSGMVRGQFLRDGSYLMGGLDHGWSTRGSSLGALQRVIWDGQTIPFEIKDIKLSPTGFRLTFTKPVQSLGADDARAYQISHWHYNYWSEYGSPKVGATTSPISRARISRDGLKVDLDVPVMAGEVYAIKVNMRSRSGATLLNNTGWYTVNQSY